MQKQVLPVAGLKKNSRLIMCLVHLRTFFFLPNKGYPMLQKQGMKCIYAMFIYVISNKKKVDLTKMYQFENRFILLKMFT